MTTNIKKHTTMKLFQALIIPTLIIATSAAPPSPSRQYLRSEPQPQVRDGVQFDHDDFEDDTVTFDDPTHHDKLLDYCLTFKNDCGKPAADAYCAKRITPRPWTFPSAGRMTRKHSQSRIRLPVPLNTTVAIHLTTLLVRSRNKRTTSRRKTIMHWMDALNIIRDVEKKPRMPSARIRDTVRQRTSN